MRILQRIDFLLKKIVISLIRIYRKAISPHVFPSCRFSPSCSEYSLNAFQKYNFFKALFLSLYRILRCNPFHSGGYDPLK
ncbi:MAG: membrane protein insertion efficiency factor YidD [Spirochaetes bacterium]|nr:membrane protein insertion efficiency factor YidD [Spirochaetota bacterium]